MGCQGTTETVPPFLYSVSDSWEQEKAQVRDTKGTDCQKGGDIHLMFQGTVRAQGIKGSMEQCGTCLLKVLPVLVIKWGLNKPELHPEGLWSMKGKSRFNRTLWLAKYTVVLRTEEGTSLLHWAQVHWKKQYKCHYIHGCFFVTVNPTSARIPGLV